MTLTQYRLKELLVYNPDTGDFHRAIQRSQRFKPGDLAGYPSSAYWAITIDGKGYKAHRLAFLYMEGYFPEQDIDHKNRDCLDNRWENLRVVSHACNVRNTGNNSRNTSGVKGVSWYKSTQRWSAKIGFQKNGKNHRVSIGYYLDFIEAVAHRLAAEQCLGWAGCDSSSPAFRAIQEYVYGGSK